MRLSLGEEDNIDAIHRSRHIIVTSLRDSRGERKNDLHEEDGAEDLIQGGYIEASPPDDLDSGIEKAGEEEGEGEGEGEGERERLQEGKFVDRMVGGDDRFEVVIESGGSHDDVNEILDESVNPLRHTNLLHRLHESSLDESRDRSHPESHLETTCDNPLAVSIGSDTSDTHSSSLSSTHEREREEREMESLKEKEKEETEQTEETPEVKKESEVCAGKGEGEEGEGKGLDEGILFEKKLTFLTYLTFPHCSDRFSSASSMDFRGRHAMVEPKWI